MSFLLSQDLSEFAKVLSKFFTAEFPSATNRRYLINEQGRKPPFGEKEQNLWAQLVELGAFSAFAPEECDGLALGALSAEVVIEEGAKSLCPLPLFETIAFGAMPVLCVGTAEQRNLIIAKILAGEMRLTGALNTVNVTSENKTGSYQLSGTIPLVPSLGYSTAFLVVAQEQNSKNNHTNSAGRSHLYLIDLNQVGASLKFQDQTAFDLLRDFSEVQLHKTPAVRVSRDDLTENDWLRLRKLSEVLTCGELVGLGEKVLSMTLDHVKTRQQFGRPIGAFQAVAHQLSDIHLEVESVKALTRFAAWAFDNDPKQFTEAAPALAAYAGEVIPKAIERALQVHGGIGFTFEYDIHLYLRRARTLAALYCDSQRGYQEVAERRIVG